LAEINVHHRYELAPFALTKLLGQGEDSDHYRSAILPGSLTDERPKPPPSDPSRHQQESAIAPLGPGSQTRPMNLNFLIAQFDFLA
jgi:hypothetical protein